MWFMIRRLLATRRGFLLVLALEAVALVVLLPRAHLPVAAFLGLFWGIATALYLSNFRMWRWLQRKPAPPSS